MTRLADGDRDAFGPVYEALWPLVRRFAERATANAHDAEDAAQTALMKVFSHAAEFDPERDALSWALGIVAYECRTLRRKAQRSKERPEDAEGLSHIEDGRESPEDQMIARDLEAAALEAMGVLRPSDMETLRLVLAGERPDIAQSTFRKRVERALDRLRAAWKAKHGTE